MLTLEELREHVGPGPSDDVLDRFLEAAIQVLDERYGQEIDYTEEVSELLRPGGSLVTLSRRASSVASVIEADVTLDPADYELRGRYVRRLSDGLSASWLGAVEIAYVPLPEDAERDRVAVALVQLDVNHNPGMTGSTTGPWSEQYAQGDQAYRAQREAIIRSLRRPSVGVW